jgi:hypothetical protein
MRVHRVRDGVGAGGVDIMTKPRATWTLWELARDGWHKRITAMPEQFDSGKEFLSLFVEMNVIRYANGYWGDPSKYRILPAGRTPKERGTR